MLIDTLKAQRILIERGFSESQADGIVEVVTDAEEQVATKHDLEILKDQLTLRIVGIQTAVTALLLALFGLAANLFG